MGMPAAFPPARWTREMFYALPEDGKRHEIIDGVHYMTPSPGGPHQLVLGELYVLIRAYVKRETLGWPVLAPHDVDLGEDTIVEPDLVVMRRGSSLPEAGTPGLIPLLAIEVISPSSVSRDRILKRRRYQRAGIAEYWIVDPEAQLVERWTPTDERPEICTDTLRWLPDGAATELVIELQPIFAAIAAR
jgi:Uma2 family endonuclease